MASILELSIDQVPDPRCEDPNDDLKVFNDWLAQFGLRMMAVRCPDGADLPQGYAIAASPSPRSKDYDHAVVTFDGQIVHDPHPSREGIKLNRFTTWEIFQVLNPTRIGR